MYIMEYHAMLSHVKPCYVMLCHASESWHPVLLLRPNKTLGHQLSLA